MSAVSFYTATLLLSFFEMLILMAIVNYFNSTLKISTAALNNIGFSVFIISVTLHLLYFNYNKKYLRLFFYRSKKGLHKLDAAIALIIFSAFKSAVYILGVL
jgi:hypothetical protein